jgi:hypothetical protein
MARILTIYSELQLEAWNNSAAPIQLAAPTGLSVVAMAGSNGASWNLVASSSGYRLQRAPVVNGVVGSFGTVYQGTNTSYTDTTATAGVVYAYRVRALGGGNYLESDYSQPVQVKTGAGGTGAPVIRVFHTYGQSLITGTGELDELDNTTLADVTPSLKREYQKGYIWNRSTQQLEKYQASVNAQGFDPTGQGKTCFCSMLGMYQRMEELFPNDIFVVLKGGKANERIESLMAGGGGVFEATRDEVWGPGWPAIMTLAQQVGASQVINMGLHFNQAQTQPDNTIDQYYANQETLLKQQLRPMFYSAAQGVDDSNFKYAISDIIRKPNFTTVKRQWVADNPTVAVSVEAWRLVHRSDDIHLTGVSHVNDGYNSLPAALGLVTISDLFLSLQPDQAGSTGSLARDFSGWHNDFIAKAGEEAVLATNTNSNKIGFTVSASHITKFTARTPAGIQRMENVPKRIHFVVQQPSTAGLEFMFCNLGVSDLTPGYTQAIATLDKTFAGGQRDTSKPCVISFVQSTINSTPTTTLFFNGENVAAPALPFFRLEGNDSIAFFSPPTNQYDSQAAKPGAWLLQSDAHIGEVAPSIVAQEIAALAAKHNVTGVVTPPPVGPVPADNPSVSQTNITGRTSFVVPEIETAQVVTAFLVVSKPDSAQGNHIMLAVPSSDGGVDTNFNFSGTANAPRDYGIGFNSYGESFLTASDKNIFQGGGLKLLTIEMYPLNTPLPNDVTPSFPFTLWNNSVLQSPLVAHGSVQQRDFRTGVTLYGDALNSSSGLVWPGQMKKALLYTRKLTAAERQQTENYLRAQYPEIS